MISPFGNATVLPAAMWNPEPTYRGTFSILSSCLITMSLCIWTAVHLNLPEHKRESEQVKRKINWLWLGLLAPEVVVWNARRQRSKMRDLSRQMSSMGFMAKEEKMCVKAQGWLARAWTEIRVVLLLRARDSPELALPCNQQGLCHSRRHPWTDVHSWYAVMGGLAFEDTCIEELQFMSGERQRMVLTPEAVIWLAKNQAELLPDISRQHIEDKSKAGGLGKFLTCWQASYFCVQCIFRFSRQYSISLLELNVFAHALCALVLFRVWWDKPQDVREPTLITDQNGLDLCAYFSLKPAKPASSESGFVALLRKSRGRTEEPIEDGPPSAGIRSRWVPCRPCSDFWEVVTPTTISLHQQRNCVAGTSNATATGIRILFGVDEKPCLKVLDTFWTIKIGEALQRDEDTCRLDGRSIRRLARAYGLCREDDDFASCPAVADRCTNWDWERLVALDRASFVPLKDLFSKGSLHLFRTAAGLTVAGGYYGGLHMTAWTCQFPSYAETVLWRAASVTILVTGPFSILSVLCTCIVNTIEASYQDWLPANQIIDAATVIQQTHRWLASISPSYPTYEFLKEGAGRGLLSLCLYWYMFCRAFIVVECFIMLAHLPDTTLEIPRWARYIPHIT
ncbi:hypothetical protein Q7P36_006454 [Cladosporium allicinum]